jgi:hypothetical protein
LPHPITSTRASQVAEKRDPCQRAAGVTLHFRSRKGCKIKISIYFKEFHMNNLFGDVIYAYTRAQAIEDGELVDVSEVAREAGFTLPVAVTRSVWDRYISWSDADTDRQSYQDESGRLWDVVSMLRMAIGSRRNESVLLYRLYVIPHDGRTRRAKLTTLKAMIHGGDNGEPVMTIMLPSED